MRAARRRRVVTAMSLLGLFLLLLASGAQADEVIVHPDPTASLAERWDWAKSQRPGDDGYWIGYSLQVNVLEGDFMASGMPLWIHRGRIHFPGVPMMRRVAGLQSTATVVEEIPPREDGQLTVRKTMAVLAGVNLEHSHRDRGFLLIDVSLPVDLRGRDLLWLGPAGAEESFAVLGHHYRGETIPHIREDLVEAMAIHEVSGVGDFLVEVLENDPDAEVQESAVSSLVVLPEDEALPILKNVIETHPNLEVRARAAETLEEFPSPRSLALLQDIIFGDYPLDVQEQAVEALEEFTGDDADELLIRVVKTHPNAELREEGVWVLAERAADKVLSLLEDVIENDRSSEVREQAVYVLAELPDGAGIPSLVKVARTHQDPELREEALMALGEIEDPRAEKALLMLMEQEP